MYNILLKHIFSDNDNAKQNDKSVVDDDLLTYQQNSIILPNNVIECIKKPSVGTITAHERVVDGLLTVKFMISIRKIVNDIATIDLTIIIDELQNTETITHDITKPYKLSAYIKKIIKNIEY